MSISQSTTRPIRTTQQSATKLSSADKEELKRLDASIDRISHAIQLAPYILTIPSDYPFRNNSRDPAAWCRNLPFDPDEEHLQYMSFILPEHADSCIVARTEVDEERDRRERERKMKGMPINDTTVVEAQQTAAKKKISLEAYKRKQARRSTPPRTETPNGVSMEKKEVITDTALVKQEDANLASKSVVADRETKRKPIGNDISQRDAINLAGGRNPLKKLKMSPPSTPPNNAHKAPAQASHNLSLKLSPPSLDNDWGLPEMLTPTLPDNIEEELARMSTESSRLSAEKSLKTTPRIALEHTTNKQADVKTDATGREANQSAQRTSAPRPSEGKKQPPGGDGHTVKLAGDIARGSAVTPSKKQRLIVKLKFKKSKWTVVQQILKLPPKGLPKKKQESDFKRNGDRGSDQIAARSRVMVEEEFHKPTEKRRRLEGDLITPEPTYKRTKLGSAAAPDKSPRTPSPSLSVQSSIQKGQQHTPLKEHLKSVAMVRTTSTESNDATPSRNPSTPAAGKHPGPTSAPGSSHTSGAWMISMNKFNDLGRKLKHEARDIFGTRVATSTAQHKRAALLNVECVMAFMLGYVSSDHHCRQDKRRPVSSYWVQTTAMWQALRKQCSDYPHLSAMMAHLGAVMASHVVTTSMMEIGNVKEAAPIVAQRKLSLFADHWEIIQRCSHEANSKLPLEDLVEQYPRTWKGRARGQRSGMWEAVLPTNLQGPYYLPFAPDTTPLQAVRFGISFLNEWIKSEGIEHELRVKL